MSSDSELFERWIAGDMRAGEAFARRYFHALTRFFRNKVARDVDDVVAETLLRLSKRRASYRGASSPRAFVFGIARLVLLEHYRAVARARELDFGVTSVHDLDPTPSQVVAEREEQRLLHEALRRIPIELQVVLELYYWQDVSTAEIAEIVEVPRGTVKSRLHRARKELARAMSSLSESPKLRESALTELETHRGG